MAETRAKLRLGPVQFDMLDRVCRTNGGGVNGYSLSTVEKRAMGRLHELGLVQGKNGNMARVVHTREGLQHWRDEKGGERG